MRSLLLLGCSCFIFACEYDRMCKWPRGSVYASDRGGADHVNRCCAVMPPLFLRPTGAAIVDAQAVSSGHCPRSGTAHGDAPYYAPDEFAQQAYLSSVPNSVCDQGEPSLEPGAQTVDPSLPSADECWGGAGADYDRSAMGRCATPHEFYTQYTNAYADGEDYRHGIPVIGSKNAPPAALLKSREVIAEMMRQIRAKQPAVADAMAAHHFRFFVWAEEEYGRNPKCTHSPNANGDGGLRGGEGGGVMPGVDSADAASNQDDGSGPRDGSRRRLLGLVDGEAGDDDDDDDANSTHKPPAAHFPRSEPRKLPGVKKRRRNQKEKRRQQRQAPALHGTPVDSGAPGPDEGSLHPEIPCGVSPGGGEPREPGASNALPGFVSGATEAQGICYPGNKFYSGRMVLIEEFFHSVHGIGIKSADPEGLNMIYRAAEYARKESIYFDTHSADCWMIWDCYVWEFFAACVQVWFGGMPFREDFLSDGGDGEWKKVKVGSRSKANPAGLLPLSRAAIKAHHRPIADALHRYFDDMSDYNPCEGVVVDVATGWVAGDENGQTCQSLAEQGAPGSALCGGKLSDEYIGPPYTPSAPTVDLAGGSSTAAVAAVVAAAVKKERERAAAAKGAAHLAIAKLRAELARAQSAAKAAKLACSGSKLLPSWITGQGHGGAARRLGAALEATDEPVAWGTEVAQHAAAFAAVAVVGYVYGARSASRRRDLLQGVTAVADAPGAL